MIDKKFRIYFTYLRNGKFFQINRFKDARKLRPDKKGCGVVVIKIQA